MSATERLTGLLEELRAELRVQDNPERRAFARLKPKPSGAVEEPYADDAFRLWEAMLRELPGDLRTVHHLAIMYHARAFDREVSSNSGSADSDWRKALELWHRLWKEDAFWEGLAQGMDSGPSDVLAGVRAGWPEQLLDVHFAIACEDGASNHRRRFHVRLALESPFPQEVRDAVRMKAYERITRAVPAAVWDGETFDPDTLQVGLKAVGRYLDLDESFLPALRDLLELLTKMQTGYVQQTNAVGEEEEGFEEKLREMQGLVRTHEPSVARLEKRLQDLVPETLSHLILWHARAGQANRILDDYELAASHYRRALLAAQREPSDPQRTAEMRGEWLTCALLSAREHAAGDKDGEAKAKSILEEIRQEELPPFCQTLSAHVRLLVGDLDAAQRDAEQALAGLKRDQKGNDIQAAQAAVELEPGCRKLLDQILKARRQRTIGPKLEAASQALQDGEAAKAIRLLDEVVKIDPECAPALFLRAQSHLGEQEFDRARRDAEHAGRLLAKQSDRALVEAVARLQSEIEEAERRVGEYGGAKSFRLQQRAVEAFNGDRFAEAADLLRQALKAARKTGRARLEQELDTCLKAQAAQLFEPAGAAAKAGDFAAARRACDPALAVCPDFFPALFLRVQCHMDSGELDAAQRDLDQAEASARRNGSGEASKAVADLRRNLKQLEQTFAENGGPQAFRLQQQAVEAFNGDRFERAAELLRQALKVARGNDKKLKKELAICLDILAVQKTNEAITLLQGNQSPVFGPSHSPRPRGRR